MNLNSHIASATFVAFLKYISDSFPNRVLGKILVELSLSTFMKWTGNEWYGMGLCLG